MEDTSVSNGGVTSSDVRGQLSGVRMRTPKPGRQTPKSGRQTPSVHGRSADARAGTAGSSRRHLSSAGSLGIRSSLLLDRAANEFDEEDKAKFDHGEKLDDAMEVFTRQQKLCQQTTRRASVEMADTFGHDTESSTAERKSFAARRRSTFGSIRLRRRTTLGLSAIALEEEDTASSGILSDFIDRGKAAAGASGMRSEDWFAEALEKSDLYKEDHIENLKGVLFVEQLSDQMMQSITCESKDRGMFLPTPASVFKRHAKLMFAFRRVLQMIEVAVENLLFRRRLMTNPVIHGKESAQERKARMSEFYGSYRPSNKGYPEKVASASSPKYSMSFDLSIQRNAINGMKWSVDAPAGSLVHKHWEKEQLLTKDGRPEDPLGAGRYPSAAMKSGEQRTLCKEVSRRLEPLRTAKRQYFDECHKGQTLPVANDFVAGHSVDFKSHGRIFTDAELLAVVGMLDRSAGIEDVDLEGNGLLTDKSLVPFLHTLSSELLSPVLTSMNISNCSRASGRTVGAAVEMVRSASNIRSLNLSNLPIGTQYHFAVCQAIGAHTALQTVNLSKTGLGNSSCITTDCLTRLLTNKNVKQLDLSWNRFDHEEFRHMGVLISQGGALEELEVDGSSAYVVGKDSPAGDLLEALALAQSLKRLSLVANRMDFRCGLVAEDALETHPNLKSLVLSENPLGSLGMRSLLRLLSRKTNALLRFDSEGCCHGAALEIQDNASVNTGAQIFSFTNPGSKYNLNLQRPYHRSLLRMLYKTAERANLDFNQAFRDIDYSEAPYSHPSKEHGIWQVARSGQLSVVFSVEAQIKSGVKGIDDSDFMGFLEAHFEMTRFRADMNKITALFAKWRELSGRELDQQIYLDALAKDFNMTLPYLAYLCKTAPGMEAKVLVELFPTLPCDAHSRYLSMLNFPKVQHFMACYPQMENLLRFNAHNPSGHYKLDLGNCCDFSVAERLILLDRWESVVNDRRGRVDTSARGNHSHLRNETYQGKPLHLRVKSVAEWSLPEYDVFETDYMSSYRVPSDVEALSDALWEDLMIRMYRSPCRPVDKIKVLRGISHDIFITSMHMRQMVGYFKDASDRLEACVIFFLRVLDMHNMKKFRVRFANEEEVNCLRQRLGFATFFPFLQPENATFSLDFAFHDQRICANMIVDLASREKMGNIKDYIFTRADGTVDNMTMGVPRGWAEYDKLPPDGVFKCRYVCAPEDRKVEHRRKLAETFAFWNPNFRDEDISWWTGLSEVGEDILDLLEFFISRYSHVNQAFRDIDGGVGQNSDANSNGELTLREFQNGLRDIGCKKFSGPNEQQRIANIFRYLDPGAEGSVSLNEWQILDQLWKEFDLSIREFVQFLVFAFGDDLYEAWTALDDDGSGELSEAEWFEAVEKIGYFGPARVVFALLDGSDDGNISYDEFIVLEAYKKQAGS
eukprot:TRINITY_DN24342_c0_g2_i1.p1 TRINITY_DN24342_c0_g2~~TRINITY_DN24342_c0_g2_i1.p1  ORF type:complete len:1419 (-),score=214.24 TRINITY_DN24342_c0_g2_i1:1039-5295(-)